MKKVLIIEDELFLRKMYAREFTNNGFEVQLAENGEAGLHVVETFLPDIILLDIIMPVMDGFAFLDAIKKDPKLSKIPVIMLTSLSQDEDKKKAQERGAIDYIVKADIRPRFLVDKVNTVIWT